MEVTRENFGEALPAMRAAISRCDFAAVDLEMSGLTTAASEEPKGIDSLQERYDKIRDAAQGLAVLQLGLATFAWDPAKKAFDAEVFNIWIFPQAVAGKDDRLMFQTSSVAFLASCNFDFTKSLCHGVPYLNQAEAAKALAELERKIDEQHNSQQQQQQQEQQQQIGGINVRSINEASRKFLADVMERASSLAAGKPNDVVVLDACNGYLRRLVYQEVPRMFSNIHVGKFDEDNRNNSNRGQASLRLTLLPEGTTVEAAERQRLEAVHSKERSDLDLSIGIGHIFKCLEDEKKPVVGHNCFLDIGHIYSKFVRPLPGDLEAFRREFHASFPMVVDTKFIFRQDENMSVLIPDSNLGKCFEVSGTNAVLRATNPTVNLSPASARYQEATEGSLYHEAGFDAYMTGTIFARAMCSWGVQGVSNWKQWSPVQQACLNRLYLMRLNAPLLLHEPNIEIDRSLVVRICNFPGKTKTFHLQRAITGALDNLKYARVTWDNDHAVFFTAPDMASLSRLLEICAESRAAEHRGRVLDGFAVDDKFSFADFDVLPFSDWVANGRKDNVRLSNKRPRPRDGAAEDPSKRAKRDCIIM